MSPSPGPQAKPEWTSLVLSSESELRIRSYVVFHRINEAVVLGMHPADPYLRRSRVAPTILEFPVGQFAVDRPVEADPWITLTANSNAPGRTGFCVARLPRRLHRRSPRRTAHADTRNPGRLQSVYGLEWVASTR
jgi:hypothetical protein